MFCQALNSNSSTAIYSLCTWRSGWQNDPSRYRQEFMTCDGWPKMISNEKQPWFGSQHVTQNANHLSNRCWGNNHGPHGFFSFGAIRVSTLFQVPNLISSWWTKSYTCSHRLIPHFGNCFWTVSRIPPSQLAKISPPSSLASTKSPLFQHARRFGKISQEARGKHCHWLVSWRLLGKIVPWAVLQ